MPAYSVEVPNKRFGKIVRETVIGPDGSSLDKKEYKVTEYNDSGAGLRQIQRLSHVEVSDTETLQIDPEKSGVLEEIRYLLNTAPEGSRGNHLVKLVAKNYFTRRAASFLPNRKLEQEDQTSYDSGQRFIRFLSHVVEKEGEGSLRGAAASEFIREVYGLLDESGSTDPLEKYKHAVEQLHSRYIEKAPSKLAIIGILRLSKVTKDWEYYIPSVCRELGVHQHEKNLSVMPYDDDGDTLIKAMKINQVINRLEIYTGRQDKFGNYDKDGCYPVTTGTLPTQCTQGEYTLENIVYDDRYLTLLKSLLREGKESVAFELIDRNGTPFTLKFGEREVTEGVFDSFIECITDEQAVVISGISLIAEMASTSDQLHINRRTYKEFIDYHNTSLLSISLTTPLTMNSHWFIAPTGIGAIRHPNFGASVGINRYGLPSDNGSITYIDSPIDQLKEVAEAPPLIDPSTGKGDVPGASKAENILHRGHKQMWTDVRVTPQVHIEQWLTGSTRTRPITRLTFRDEIRDMCAAPTSFDFWANSMLKIGAPPAFLNFLRDSGFDLEDNKDPITKEVFEEYFPMVDVRRNKYQAMITGMETVYDYMGKSISFKKLFMILTPEIEHSLKDDGHSEKAIKLFMGNIRERMGFTLEDKTGYSPTDVWRFIEEHFTKILIKELGKAPNDSFTHKEFLGPLWKENPNDHTESPKASENLSDYYLSTQKLIRKLRRPGSYTPEEIRKDEALRTILAQYLVKNKTLLYMKDATSAKAFGYIDYFKQWLDNNGYAGLWKVKPLEEIDIPEMSTAGID